MNSSTKTTVGIRSSHFSNMVIFLTEVLNLQMISYDKQEEFAQLKLPSGQILEIFGGKNLWRPFTSPPDWEVIVADIRTCG